MAGSGGSGLGEAGSLKAGGCCDRWSWVQRRLSGSGVVGCVGRCGAAGRDRCGGRGVRGQGLGKVVFQQVSSRSTALSGVPE